MIDRRIVKFKLRRGTDDQRKYVVFEEGEMIYTTDTKKVYVGDGRLSGGNLLNNGIFHLSGMPAAATANDLIYRGDQRLMYIVNSETDNKFVFVGPYGDDNTITYGANRLTLALSGVAPKHLNSTVANNLSGIGLSVSGLYVYYDPATLTISDGRLKVVASAAVSGVSAAPGGGLVKGEFGFGVTVDDKTLAISQQIDGNDLHVKQISAQHIAPASINVTKLSADVAAMSGVKLVSDGLAVNFDASTLALNGDGKLTLNNSGYLNQKSLSGYQVLQGGFTLQWGVLSAITFNETFTTATFPTPFTSCYNVQATISKSSAVVGSITPIIKSITTTSVSIGTDLGFNTTPTTGDIYWVAIGYKI